MKNFHAFIVALMLAAVPLAEAYEASIDGEHSSITFKVDSTWHIIDGEAKEYSGKIVFDDPLSPTTVTGQIEIKSASLDTGLKMRDEKLHDYSLEVKKYPLITYKITGYHDGELAGELTIKEVTKPLALKVTSEKKESFIEYTGVAQIDWSDYNVLDPSIFIAKLDKKMTITVIVRFTYQ